MHFDDGFCVQECAPTCKCRSCEIIFSKQSANARDGIVARPPDRAAPPPCRPSSRNPITPRMSSDVVVFVLMLAGLLAAVVAVAALLKRFTGPRYPQGALPYFSRGYLLS